MRVLIVGGDAAGLSAASQIRRRRPSWTVEVFEMGRRTSYGLCGTPYYIGGLIDDIEDLVTLSPEELERQRGIKVHLGCEVLAVNAASKSLELREADSGKRRREHYDLLLLATGAEPIVPPGLEPGPEGLYYLRSLDDAQAIRQAAGRARRAVVVGAGYIGLELAENLLAAGLEVTLVGRQAAPLFEPELRTVLAQALARPGLEFRCGVKAVGLSRQSDGSLAVALSQGPPALGELVVVGAGVRPRSQLAAAAGLSLGAGQAIKVDRNQRSSNPFIYAAGDCAESFHLISRRGVYLPLALSANRQGRVAGLNICGLKEDSPAVLGSSIFKIFDLAAARTGLGYEEALAAGFGGAVKTVVNQPSKAGYYPGSKPVTAALIHDKISGRLLGGQLAGPVEAVGQRINTLAALLTGGLSVRQAAALETAYAPPFSPLRDPVLLACEIASKNYTGPQPYRL